MAHQPAQLRPQIPNPLALRIPIETPISATRSFSPPLTPAEEQFATVFDISPPSELDRPSTPVPYDEYLLAHSLETPREQIHGRAHPSYSHSLSHPHPLHECRSHRSGQHDGLAERPAGRGQDRSPTTGVIQIHSPCCLENREVGFRLEPELGSCGRRLHPASSILVPHGGTQIEMEGISDIDIKTQPRKVASSRHRHHRQHERQDHEEACSPGYTGDHVFHCDETLSNGERDVDNEANADLVANGGSSAISKRRKSLRKSISTPTSTLGSCVRGTTLPADIEQKVIDKKTSRIYVRQSLPLSQASEQKENSEPGHIRPLSSRSDGKLLKGAKPEQMPQLSRQHCSACGLSAAQQHENDQDDHSALASDPIALTPARPRRLTTVDPLRLGKNCDIKVNWSPSAQLTTSTSGRPIDSDASVDPSPSTGGNGSHQVKAVMHSTNQQVENTLRTVKTPVFSEIPVPNQSESRDIAPQPVVLRTLAQAKEVIDKLAQQIKDVESERDWAWGALVWTNRIADITILSSRHMAITVTLGRMCGRYLSDPLPPPNAMQWQLGFPGPQSGLYSLLVELAGAVGSRTPDLNNLDTDPLSELVFLRAIRTLMSPYDATTPLDYSLTMPEEEGRVAFFAPPDVLWLLVHTGDPLIYHPLLNAIRTTLWSCPNTQCGVAALLLFGRLQGGKMRLGLANKRWAREQGASLERNGWRLSEKSHADIVTNHGMSLVCDGLYRVNLAEVQGALDHIKNEKNLVREEKGTESAWILPDRKIKGKGKGKAGKPRKQRRVERGQEIDPRDEGAGDNGEGKRSNKRARAE